MDELSVTWNTCTPQSCGAESRKSTLAARGIWYWSRRGSTGIYPLSSNMSTPPTSRARFATLCSHGYLNHHPGGLGSTSLPSGCWQSTLLSTQSSCRDTPLSSWSITSFSTMSMQSMDGPGDECIIPRVSRSKRGSSHHTRMQRGGSGVLRLDVSEDDEQGVPRA